MTTRRVLPIALGFMVVALLAGNLVTAGLGGIGGGSDAAPPPDPSIAEVIGVADGDTIRVRFVSNATRRVRYVGVDTPELSHCYGRTAANANNELVAGEKVRLVFDDERRDRYGRLLAYVYRARDQRFVNLALARRGLAVPLTIPPNNAHAGEIRHAVRSARAAGLGLWGACGETARPARR